MNRVIGNCFVMWLNEFSTEFKFGRLAKYFYRSCSHVASERNVAGLATAYDGKGEHGWIAPTHGPGPSVVILSWKDSKSVNSLSHYKQNITCTKLIVICCISL